MPVYPFQPDIGPAKLRRVESDRDQFVQRLHDHARLQEARTEQLRREGLSRVAGAPKVIHRNDVEAFLERSVTRHCVLCYCVCVCLMCVFCS